MLLPSAALAAITAAAAVTAGDPSLNPVTLVGPWVGGASGAILAGLITRQLFLPREITSRDDRIAALEAKLAKVEAINDERVIPGLARMADVIEDAQPLLQELVELKSTRRSR